MLGLPTSAASMRVRRLLMTPIGRARHWTKICALSSLVTDAAAGRGKRLLGASPVLQVIGLAFDLGQLALRSSHCARAVSTVVRALVGSLRPCRAQPDGTGSILSNGRRLDPP